VACTKCTYLNKPVNTSCELCNTVKPIPTPTPEQVSKIEEAKAEVAALERQLKESKDRLAALEAPFKKSALSFVGSGGGGVGFGSGDVVGGGGDGFGGGGGGGGVGDVRVGSTYSRFIRDSLQTVTNFHLCSLSASAEIYEMGSLCFEEIRALLKVYLEAELSTIITMTNLSRRSTVLAQDVLGALVLRQQVLVHQHLRVRNIKYSPYLPVFLPCGVAACTISDPTCFVQRQMQIAERTNRQKIYSACRLRDRKHLLALHDAENGRPGATSGSLGVSWVDWTVSFISCMYLACV
jgi:hypothetical protein